MMTMKMRIILGRTGSRTIPIPTLTGMGVGDRLSSSLLDRSPRHFGTLQPQSQSQPPIAPPQYLQQQQFQLRQVEEGAAVNAVKLRSASVSASVVAPLMMMRKKNSRNQTNLFRRYYSTSKINLEKEKEIEEKKEDNPTTITTATDASSSSDTTVNATTTTTTKEEGDVYDPWEIVTTFQDTSYYTPPDDEVAPEYLAAKYAHLSNADLLDATTIGRTTTTDSKDPTTETTTTTETTNLWHQYMHSPPVRDTNQSFRKGTLFGVVCSTKMDKTINVEVDRYKVHQKYHKRLKYTKKFMAHDEHEVAMLGDTVLISPCQRLSKKKHFMLQSIVTAKGQL